LAAAEGTNLHIAFKDMQPTFPYAAIAADCAAYHLALACAHDLNAKRWKKLLNEKGRIPFIEYPSLCVKCGTLWPEMFNVPDAEWKHYVKPQMQDKMLCEACYTQIKAWIDGEGFGWRP
jgi:hypothetical protein